MVTYTRLYGAVKFRMLFLVSATFCKLKWRYLRDSYLREKRLNKTKSGQAAKPRKQWKYSELMRFVDDTIIHEETYSNVPQVCAPGETPFQETQWEFMVADTSEETESTQTTIQANSEVGHVATDVSPGCSSSYREACEESQVVSGPNSARKRKHVGKELDSFEKYMLGEVKKCNESEDEDTLFCLSLACGLKRLPKQIKGATKIKLMSVMMEAENEADEQTS